MPTAPHDISDDDRALTARQGAALLGIHVVTFWQQVEDRWLPPPFYPAPRAPRWWRSRLLQAAREKEQLPAEAEAARRARKLAADRVAAEELATT